MKRSNGYLLLAVAAMLFFYIPAGFAAEKAKGSFQKTLKVSGPVDLDVVTGSGNIAIRTGDGSTVVVNAVIEAQDYHGASAESRVKQIESNPPIEQAGNTIRIGHTKDREMEQNVSISYDLVIPAETRLRAATGSGNQTLDGIRGVSNVSTGSGDMKISNMGEVHANTGSGTIQVDATKGPVQVNTGSGSIRGNGLGGNFSARTGSGSVIVTQASLGNVDISTGSGTIQVNGINGTLTARTGSGKIQVEGAQKGDWKLHAGSGNLLVKLPTDAAFSLKAHTESGKVTTSHPVTSQGTIRPNEMQGTVRGGGPLLEMNTGSGDIRIE